MADEAQTTEEVLDPSQDTVTTPEDTPAEAVVETEATPSGTEGTETPSEPSGYQSKPQRPSKNERIIREVMRSRDDWKLEAEKWYQIAQGKQAHGASDTHQTKPPATKPKLEDFENDYEKYMEALADWKSEIRVKAELSQEIKRITEAQQAQREREQAEARERIRRDKVQEAIRKYPELQEPLTDDVYPVPISESMAEAIIESDHTAEILKHLAANRDEAARIYKLTPTGAVRAIGKIERDIEIQKIIPKPKTKAPEPITPIAGTGKAPVVKSLEEMTVEEYIAYRNKQEFGR